MKIASADIAHKSDLGLVEPWTCASEAEARRTYTRIVAAAREAAPRASVDGVLVAETVRGLETVAGIAHDDLFGPVVMFGLGGVLVEVLRDVTFRVPPFGQRDATAMMGELRGAALLDGVRGAPAVDRDALVDVLMKLQHLAVDLAGEVAEVDVNPLWPGRTAQLRPTPWSCWPERHERPQRDERDDAGPDRRQPDPSDRKTACAPSPSTVPRPGTP